MKSILKPITICLRIINQNIFQVIAPVYYFTFALTLEHPWCIYSAVINTTDENKLWKTNVILHD